MLKTSSIYSAFNARWLSPEDVARAFVPTSHFETLVRFQNSILMGPRGCGKTTLLKMLTRRAQKVWKNERIPFDRDLSMYRSPDFEAIYVPSDVRWSQELKSVLLHLPTESTLAEQIQRVEVSISAVTEALTIFQLVLDDANQNPEAFLKAFIDHFSLGRTIPSFSQIRLRLASYGEEVRSAIVAKDLGHIRSVVQRISPVFSGYSLDAVRKACDIFQEFVPTGLMPSRWALCFDEIEIAPRWLQQELLKAFRSFDQKFLLKITWSPVLPDDLLKDEQDQQDFATIPMWHALASDARPFCKTFTARFISDRLGSDLKPRQVFGPSPFSQEEGDSYEAGSVIWSAMVSLAKKDASFREYLVKHGFDPQDPVTESVKKRDETLRKIKPIVLVREANLSETSGRFGLRRTRKLQPLYHGEEVIYFMSEGNPRLLAGLLNDLFDAEQPPHLQAKKQVRPEIQARVLTAASDRTRTAFESYPVQKSETALSLRDLINRLGNFLSNELISSSFDSDPIGSFIVDEAVDDRTLETVSVGLLVGAFVQIGASGITTVRGSRIRLTHMVAPSYELLFRNMRQIRLSTILKIPARYQRLQFGLYPNETR